MNPNINRALITDLAFCHFIEEKVCILIVGPCGTGQSHIPQALGHCTIRAGYDVLFTTVSKMLAQLNAPRANNGFDRYFAKLAAVNLLIIDDFGLKPLQGSQDEDFHDVIAERYEPKSTIVTSNLDIPDWTEAFPNRILGAATLDRLRHRAYKIVLEEKTTGQPNRLQKHQKQPKKQTRREVKDPSLKSRPKSLLGHFQVAPLRRSWVARLRRSLTLYPWFPKSTASPRLVPDGTWQGRARTEITRRNLSKETFADFCHPEVV